MRGAHRRYTVVEAADGEEALELYRRHRPDLVVLDLILPKLDGLEVCRRIQTERKGVRLVGEVSEDVDPVLANLPKLQRVLYNLMSNALRHIPAGGAISLRAEPRGELVEVEIVDTGGGIASEELPHIFERSFRGE